MAADPASESAVPANPQTWNRYTYGLNNPLILVDPTGTIVQVSGAGQNQGVADLGDTTHQNLSVDSQGNLQAADFIGPRTPAQQLVENAIASPNTVSLNFETRNDAFNFGADNGDGSHSIDVGDTAALKSPDNKSAFTAGGVVLHELAEGYAQTSLNAATFKEAHTFANQFAPGLSQPLPGIEYLGTGGMTMGVRFSQQVQDGSGTLLRTTMALSPPVSYPTPSGYVPKGPVVAVKSTP